MRKYILVFITLVFTFPLWAQQQNTEFWFAAPHMCEHSRVTGGYHIVLFSYDKPSHIELTMPANPNFIPKIFDLAAYDYIDIVMANDYDDAMNNFEVPFDVVSQRGIHIVSTNEIGGYYQHTGNNSEAFSFKKEAIGKHFLVSSQISYLTPSDKTYIDAYSSLQIVATEDNTDVTIEPLLNHTMGKSCSTNTITVTLDKGETYAIRSCNKDPIWGVNGTMITATNPIAVTSTDDSTQPIPVHGEDLSGDQIVPIDYAGNEYVVVGQGKEWNTCYITGLENQTSVQIGNGVPFTIQMHETKSIPMNTYKVLWVKSNKPIIIYQLTGEDDEAGGTVLPALECTGSKHVTYKRVPNSLVSIFNIVIKSKDDECIYINNNKVASNEFHPIDGTSEWKYASIHITNSFSEVIKVESTHSYFHLGVLDVIGESLDNLQSCSYCYFSNYGTSHEYEEHASFSQGGHYDWLGHFESDGKTIMSFYSEGTYIDTLKDENDCDSLCVLDLKVIPYPDNIDTLACRFLPDANSFDIKEKYSTWGVNSMTTPLVADMDGDSLPEIIACAWTNQSPYLSAGLLVINGQNGDLKYTIPTVPYRTSGQKMTIADVNRDSKCEIFIQGEDKYVYCYDEIGNIIWKSVNQLTNYCVPLLADINNDGNAELVIDGCVFSAIDGTLILKMDLLATGMGFAAPHSNSYYHPAYYMPALYDIDGDGTLELCAGNTIYKMQISNCVSELGNTWSVLRNANETSTITNYDGQTIIIDFDKDGDGDICVLGLPHNLSTTNPCYYDVYVWDGQTSEILAHKRFQAVAYGDNNVWYGMSIPYAGDINGDYLPEIVFNAKDIGMIACAYDETKPENMSIIHNYAPYAETCGFTVFDFNQDGKNEIVYRGDSLLTIVDGSTLQNLCTPIRALSGTLTEYPVVADVNGDGHAEIVIARSATKYKGGKFPETTQGWVSVYESAIPNAWSSARPVWNQWAYNSVNINDDMTVPQYQYDIATQFPNGTKPFNSFLAQKPIIDKQGDIFVPAADANVTAASYEIINDSIKISVSYCNTGDANLVAPYEITVYQNEYRGSVIQVDTVTESLRIDSCTEVTLKVPALSVCQIARDTAFIIAINDDGHGIAQHGNQQAECDITNNQLPINLKGNIQRDTTYNYPIICDSELPYTHPTTGVIFPKGTSEIVDSCVTLLNQQGCDSIVLIKLTVLPTFAVDTFATINHGESLIWYEHTCTTEDEYQHKFQSLLTGCDSVVTLHLTVEIPVYDTTAYVCEGSIFEWYGNEAHDGDKKTFIDISGHDSIVTLHLITIPIPSLVVKADTMINKGDTALLWATGADYYSWEPAALVVKSDAQYVEAYPTISTTFTVTGYNEAGKNMLVNGDFELGNTGFTTTYKYYEPRTTNEFEYGKYTIGQWASDLWPTYQTSTRPDFPGYNNSWFMVVDGSESPDAMLWEQTVEVKPNNDYALSCLLVSLLASNKHGKYALLQFYINGQPIGEIFHSPSSLHEWTQFYEVWNSGTATSATIQIINQNNDAAGNDFGLDNLSFVPLMHDCATTEQVTVLVAKTETEEHDVCSNELPYSWHGRDLTISGTYTDTILSTSGFKDSIVTLLLTVKEAYAEDDYQSKYQNELPFIWNGFEIADAGDDGKIYSTTSLLTGCDSVITLHLTVLPPVITCVDTIPVVTRFDWVLMIHRKAIKEMGFDPTIEQIKWYKVVGEPDSIPDPAGDDIYLTSGYSYTMDANLQGSGLYYAVMDATTADSIFCQKFIRSRLIKYNTPPAEKQQVPIRKFILNEHLYIRTEQGIYDAEGREVRL